MPIRLKSLAAGFATLVVLVTGFSEAEASCLRKVANRSTLTLVVGQGDGGAVTVRPGTLRTIRLDGSAPVDVTGYCDVPRRGAPFGQPVVQRSFPVTAVMDRCFYEIGNGFFERELGPSFFPRDDTGAFALNTPRQGDLALGPSGEFCPAIR